MKAAVLVKPGDIQFQSLPIPAPLPGEVRVKLRMTGICGSDVHFFNGDRLLGKPTIIGHEGLGEIDLVSGEIAQSLIGKRVVIEPNIPCRNCKQCLQGKGNICPNKRIIGLNEPGCFAEYVCLPLQYCHILPDSISDADAVTIEPMAVAYHALFTARAKPGDTIAIMGLGAIGLLITHLAVSLGYRVLANDLFESKKTQAIAFGAIVNADFDENFSLASYWETEQVSAVFECSGSAKAASLVTANAPGFSQVVLVGLSENLTSFQPLKIVRQGIEIIGSIIYDHPFDFQRVIKLIERGIIQPGRIISDNIPFSNISEAFALAKTGVPSKIIISIN